MNRESEQQGGDWEEVEIKRFIRREGAMRAAGAIEKEAESMAEQMLYRDRGNGDDRRVCFECARLDGRMCKALRLEPIRWMLQRCERFVMRSA